MSGHPAKENTITTKTSLSAILTASLCCLAAFPALAAHVSAGPLCIRDIIKPPINLSISGTYYSNREKGFSVDVSPDRFIKTYSDGVTIIGVKGEDTPVYYIIDKNKKTVSKVSQTNLYKIGLFFNWNSMTTLVDLPGNTAVTAQNEAQDGCTMYLVAGADAALCVDGNYHIPLRMSQRGAEVARVASVKPLHTDLKTAADSLTLTCRQDHYTFFDVDSEMAPEAD
ncbi:MAG: hypothetical protein ABSG35_12245 [Syntrophobacteraceae bacterium]|jgi:hypothetical protein